MSRTQRTLLARIVLWIVLPLMALAVLMSPELLATDLELNSLSRQRQIEFAVRKATMDATSTLYDGQANADKRLYAGTSYDIWDGELEDASPLPDSIDCGGANAIDIWLGNSAATENGTLCIIEASADPPTAATIRRITEVTIADADLVFDPEREAWGLATGTNINCKVPVRVTVLPGSYVTLHMSADEGGGLWYARYAIVGSN